MTHAFRLFPAALSAAALVFVGCPEPEAGPCGVPEAFSSVGCAGALPDVVREGVWHGLVTFDGGTSTRQVISHVSFVGDGGTLTANGGSIVESDFEGAFFLASELPIEGQRVRHAFYGCQSPNPQTVTGQYQVCLNGRVRNAGAFELRRVGRPDGEGEAHGLELVGEQRLTQGAARDVVVYAGRAYVAADDGLATIVDVTDPADPQVRAQMSSPATSQNEAWFDVAVFENVLYIAGNPRGVRAYDLSTGALIPPLLTEFPAQQLPVRSLTVDAPSRRLLANAFSGEVLIYDINNPGAPVLIGVFQATNASGPVSGAYPRASAILGDRLYAAFGPLGIVVADIADVDLPTQLAEPFRTGSAHSNGLQVISDAAAVLAYETTEGWGGHVRVVDVTTPAAASIVAEYQTREHVSAAQTVVRGTRAYVAYHQDGVRILDITDPRAPTQIAYFDTHDDTRPGAGASFFEGASGIFPAEDDSRLVYVADPGRGLLILRETL